MMRCPRKKTDMTPCVVTDGPVAYAIYSRANQRPICVGCERSPATTGVPEPADWNEQCQKYFDDEEKRNRRRRR